MNLRLALLAILIIPLSLFAQKKQKPKLLVYGSDIAAFSAAVQAARSNVPTVWVLDQAQIAPEITSQAVKINSNQKLDGGIWMNILMEIAVSKAKSDSLAQMVKQDLNPRLAQNALDKIIAELPNLTLIKNQQISKTSQKKRGWDIQLSNRLQFSVLSLLDFSEKGSLYTQAEKDDKPYASNAIQKAADVSLALGRTSVGAAELDGSAHVILLKDLLTFERNNLLDAGFLRQVSSDPNNIAFRAAYGQALGATAAYLAFFKTNSKSIDIRKLQAELMAFSARLTPYQDVSSQDTHFGSIQKNYLTGFFLGQVEDGKYLFKKDDFVRFDDVKAVMNDIYTRSQLWFLDNFRNEDLTWGDLFGLIKYVSLKGDEVQKQVEKEWNSKRKFQGEFSLKNKVTREHFAVMADLYSNSFSKTINLDGSFVK